MRTLTAGGAEVALCASNPLSTQDDVAAALVETPRRSVHARAGEDPETYYRHIDAVLDTKPRLTIDDGADLVGVLHGQRTDLLEGILGGTEETTTGVIRLRALEAQGKLAFPVIAVAESVTGRQLDHRYGTGQSTLDGILRATNILLAGQRVVVVGYGARGGRRGGRRRARIVCGWRRARFRAVRTPRPEGRPPVCGGREAARAARGDAVMAGPHRTCCATSTPGAEGAGSSRRPIGSQRRATSTATAVVSPNASHSTTGLEAGPRRDEGSATRSCAPMVPTDLETGAASTCSPTAAS